MASIAALIARAAGGSASIAIPAIGDAVYGGYYAGMIDTTTGNIIAADASQTGAKYLLIVAPKSLESAALAYKTANNAAPASSSTRWNGLAASSGMTGATYPASNYCNGLTYPSDGGSAWYLPAMDELELIYRNLKPTTDSNTVATRVAGTFPGTTAAVGQNVSSSPSGGAYTTGAPAQTSIAIFRTGGAQSLDNSGGWYWTSTEYDTAYARLHNFPTFQAGNQSGNNKATTYSVRPVRRVLL